MPQHEIRVTPEGNDPRAQALMQQAKSMLGLEVELGVTRVFYVEEDGIHEQDAIKLANEFFTDPLVERNEVGDSERDDPLVVEVAYHRDTMVPQDESITAGVRMLTGKHPAAVDYTEELHFAEGTAAEIIYDVVTKIAMNKTVQEIRRSKPDTLVISGEAGPVETIPVRELNERELEELSAARSMFLDSSEMKNAQDYFIRIGREPTDGELETLAATWSEHCCHKTFKADVFVNGELKEALFDRMANASRQYMGEDIVSAYEDNAGVFMFYEGMCINIKLETHNSPSALEPYGGAMTGSGGVFRDVMGTGQGAKVILSIDIFCFAPPDMNPELLPENCLDPAYLQQRVIDGVRDYGNRMGIPTANGSVHYDEDFRAKPTVMVGALGIMPEQYARKGHAEAGDLVVAVGGKTGRDGVHGATFSSGSMTAETAGKHSSAVQIGNAIEEKRTSDALLEARDAGCIRALTDCGAAGFCSAIGEMGEEIGVQVDLSKAPLKYEGLSPWEIWVSESQERMVAAIDPEKYDEFVAICNKHDVEASNLGTFGTVGDEPKLQVNYGEQSVVDLHYDFLKNGLTKRRMVAEYKQPEIAEIKPGQVDWDETIKKILAHGDIASKEKITRQYDTEVQANSVIKPYAGVHRDAPNDAVVLAPIPGKPYGLVTAHGMNPRLNNYDPTRGTKWAFAEAMANYVAAGGNPDKANLVNNFVTATPDAHVMGVLDKMIDAEVECIHAIKRPVISGKDSLSSRYKNKDGTVIDIPPVLTFTVSGGIDDIEKTVTTDIKKANSALVMVGKADYEAMGGSVFHEVSNGSSANIPDIDLEQLPKTLQAVHAAEQTGKVLACHDVSEGGIITTVFEMCSGGDCGAVLQLSDELNPENELYNETAGCFVVEVADAATAAELFADVPHRVIGSTKRAKTITAYHGKGQLFSADLDELKAANKRMLEEAIV